jgi:glycosyltransferase involved in cell wall biosynthesis
MAPIADAAILQDQPLAADPRRTRTGQTHVMILGTRGIPAQHGGFETFAEDLSLHLAARGHRVTVYCQTESLGTPSAGALVDTWSGVRRVLIPAPNHAIGTVSYDWASTLHASRDSGVVLTLGYNTAVFSLAYRFRHMPSVMNMDGIEWKRQKWSLPEKVWLWLNERAGSRFANHLVADHPEIAAHLRAHTPANKITVIPYGADAVIDAPTAALEPYSLSSKGYYLLIARPEPENSILEIVRAFDSNRVRTPLLVLGNYNPGRNAYHRQVKEAARRNVIFAGSIYDRATVQALRFHAKAYIHGHRVGGTNPSLVESLGAGNAILAHDNPFNRWVAGPGALYFRGARDLEQTIAALEGAPHRFFEMEQASRERHSHEFTKEKILSAYEDLLLRVSVTTK